MQSLASDTGISDKTVKSWLSILETCYMIHYVRPHFANFGKRLVKQPKRDNTGTEVDLIIERCSEVAAVEIKSGITVASDAFGNLKK